MVTGSRFDKIKDKIKSWLLAEQCQFKEIPEAGAHWLIEIPQGDGLSIAAGQEMSSPDKIALAINIEVDNPKINHLGNLPKEERDRFLWDLRFRLLAMDVEFRGLGIPLTVISITEDLYADSLSRSEFLSAIRKLRRGALAVVWSLEQLASITPDASETSFGLVN